MNAAVASVVQEIVAGWSRKLSISDAHVVLLLSVPKIWNPKSKAESLQNLKIARLHYRGGSKTCHCAGRLDSACLMDGNRFMLLLVCYCWHAVPMSH